MQHKALEAAVAKDSKDGAALASSSFASLNKKLSEKFKHIEVLNAKYQQVRHLCNSGSDAEQGLGHELQVCQHLCL
jgi:hypothetical protein